MSHYRNPAHLLGLGRNTALTRLLRACGTDEAFVTGGASDFDKFSALAEAIPLCAGHEQVARINRTLQEATGLSAPLCPHTAPAIWQAWTELHWYGREPAPRACPLTCPLCAPCEPRRITAAEWNALCDPLSLTAENLGQWTKLLETALESAVGLPCISLPSDYTFVRPDPYHAGEALRRMARGESLDPRETHLLLTQALRTWGLYAVRHDRTLCVGGGSAESMTALLAYLDTSRALTSLVWLASNPTDAGQISGLYTRVTTGLDLRNHPNPDELTARYAAVAPLGRAVMVTEPLHPKP